MPQQRFSTENQMGDAKQRDALFLSVRVCPESGKISWGNLGAIPPLGAVCAGGGGGACFGSNQLRRALSSMTVEQAIYFHDLGALAVSRIQHCGNCSPCHIQPRGIICISGGRHCKALSVTPWLWPAQTGSWKTGRCSICCLLWIQRGCLRCREARERVLTLKRVSFLGVVSWARRLGRSDGGDKRSARACLLAFG